MESAKQVLWDRLKLKRDQAYTAINDGADWPAVLVIFGGE
jgi:hypothetical protein